VLSLMLAGVTGPNGIAVSGATGAIGANGSTGDIQHEDRHCWKLHLYALDACFAMLWPDQCALSCIQTGAKRHLDKWRLL